MFWNTEVAYKYKMSSMQATLGLAQLERIEELVGRKRQIFDWYRSKLGSVEGITLNYEAPGTKNAYWMVTVVLDEKLGLKKGKFMMLMLEKGIDCRPFFHPLSSIPAYQELEQAEKARRRNKNAYKISPYGLNLPSGMNMTNEKVGYVCEVLKSILKNQRDNV